ncbi:hypothetical protein WDW37_06715 [Bdellovibrionota bacterium FG-1]
MKSTNSALTARKKPSTRPFSYVNRKGDAYFLHQGTTKLGKPKYFFSRSPEGSLSEIPSGFVVTESINAVVSLARPRPTLIPTPDTKSVETRVRSYRHLVHHHVESKGNSILIYAPIGQDLIERTKPEEFSVLASLKPFFESLGRSPGEFLSEIASNTGMTVEQIQQMDKAASEEKRSRFTDKFKQTMQYDPVMRFVFEKHSGQYRVDRRCYRGEHDWLSLGVGSIESLAAKYVRHIGKESFFELF